MNHGEWKKIPPMAGGFKVKKMIETVEEKMAGGQTVSAAPISEAEVENLKTVQAENQKSAQRADGM